VTLENVRAEVKRILRPTTPMPATIIDGKAIAAQVRAEVAERVAALKEQRGVTPGLAVVLVGGDPASVSYVRAKGQAAEEVGIFSQTFHLPAETPQSEVLELIARLNADQRIHAMLVQLPLPSHLDEQAITAAVDPQKDADALHPVNVGRLFKGEPYLLPCTPAGIVELLVRTGHPPDGKHVVICGRSNLVGRPLAAILIQKRKGANATVTVCHTGTRDLARFTRQADILVAAMGAPRAITVDMVRPGAVVIDVGVNRVEDAGRKSGYRLVGDVDFEPVARVAVAITPVPGGVGPMTVAMLLANTVAAAEAQTAVEEVPHDR
jgi:methylenetetrahydrofolate dehydrogenase (NADP+)/methenyltetrahydrofolate cyclohydrolase